MKVLVADDDEISRIVLRKMLEALGHDVIERADGNSALAAITELEPQLVLLDWMMPGPTGPEICRSIRTRPSEHFIYSILVTSKDSKEDVVAGLRSGANDFISKPIRLGELQARLNVATQMIELHNRISAHRTNALASAKMAYLGEMASGIAHEVNNPLAIILGRTEILHDSMVRGELDVIDANMSFESIARACDRIAQIVTALQTFAGDSASADVRLVRAADVVRGTLAVCEARALSQGIEIQKPEIDPNIVFWGQPEMLSQALLNLMQNAFQAVRDLAPRWVRVEATRTEESVVISVTDSGLGIPAAIREKIVQPFFTTREVGEGAGLGLSVAKGIVGSHRGSLELDVDAKNTRFVIRIPRGDLEQISRGSKKTA